MGKDRRRKLILDLISRLEKGSTTHENHIKELNFHIQTFGFTYEQFNLSEERIAEFRKKGYKATAENFLRHLRSRKNRSAILFIGLIRQELARGNFSLGDIGTNEEELKGF